MEDQKQQIKDLRIEIGNLEDKVAALSKENETFKRDNNRWSGQVNDPTLSMPLNFRNKQAINTHVAYPIRHSLTGTEPATAANYEVFFTADYPCEVVLVSFSILSVTALPSVPSTRCTSLTDTTSQG